MKTTALKLFLAIALTSFTAIQANAQRGGGAGGFGGAGGGFDMSQMQQQIQQMAMTACREQLSVTNDEDWKAIEPRITKVMQLQADATTSSLGILRVLGSANGRGGMGGGAMGGMGGMGMLGGMFGGSTTESAESTTLQRTIDSKGSATELKTALDKYREARNRKKADLAKAQDDLRKLVSTRQEAVLVSLGFLE